MNHVTQAEEFARIVEELTAGGSGINLREQARHSRSISLNIQPLGIDPVSLDFQETGAAFWAISRDISHHGLAFINSEPVSSEYLRIGLLDHDIPVIGQVRHSTSIGDHYPLYLIGVEFIG